MARTQAERRETTKAALLDAAAACLTDSGVAGFTTSEVVKRAGLSNGALFRHFPTKSDLLAATIEHVFARLRDDYERAFLDVPSEGRTVRVLLEMLWAVMDDPVLAAAYDVYTSARCDAWLQAAIEPVVREHVERLAVLGRELLHEVPGIADEVIDRAVSLSILAMQGLVVNLMATPDPAAVTRLLDDLESLSAVLLPIPAPA